MAAANGIPCSAVGADAVPAGAAGATGSLVAVGGAAALVDACDMVAVALAGGSRVAVMAAGVTSAVSWPPAAPLTQPSASQLRGVRFRAPAAAQRQTTADVSMDLMGYVGAAALQHRLHAMTLDARKACCSGQHGVQ